MTDADRPEEHPSRQMPTPVADAYVRRWARTLDGPHDWGMVVVSGGRHEMARYRLIVFPPGIDPVDRRLLRLWRAWPLVGAVLMLTVQIVVNFVASSGVALGAACAAYVLGGAALHASSAALRVRVRSMTVVRSAGADDPRSRAMFTELKALLGALCYADEQRELGRWSPASHEAIWWQVYDRLNRSPGGEKPLLG